MCHENCSKFISFTVSIRQASSLFNHLRMYICTYSLLKINFLLYRILVGRYLLHFRYRYHLSYLKKLLPQRATRHVHLTHGFVLKYLIKFIRIIPRIEYDYFLHEPSILSWVLQIHYTSVSLCD